MRTCCVSRVLRACRLPALSAVCCSLKVLLNWLVRMPDSSPSSSPTLLASKASLCCTAYKIVIVITIIIITIIIGMYT